MQEEKSLLSRIVTWTIIVVLALVALKVLGAIFGLVTFLVFTVVPVVILGWIAVKAYQAFAKQPTT